MEGPPVQSSGDAGETTTASERQALVSTTPQVPQQNIPLPYAPFNPHYVAEQGPPPSSQTQQESYFININGQLVEVVPKLEGSIKPVTASHEGPGQPSIDDNSDDEWKVECDCQNPCPPNYFGMFRQDIGHGAAFICGLCGVGMAIAVIILCSDSILSKKEEKATKKAFNAIIALAVVSMVSACVAFTLYLWQRCRRISHRPYVLSFVLCLVMCILWFAHYPECKYKKWKCYWYYDDYWDEWDCSSRRVTNDEKTQECEQYRLAVSLLGPLTCLVFFCAVLLGHFVKTVRK